MFLKSTLKVLSSSPDLVSQTLKVDKSCESWNLGNDIERGWGRECRKRRKAPFFLMLSPTENANTSKTPRTRKKAPVFLNSLEIASPENARKTSEYEIFSLR